MPVLWLESTEEGSTRALLASEATDGLIAPDGSAVAYRSRGALWVTRLARMPRDQFVTGRNDAARSEAMSDAKWITLAALMYAEDNDERWPPAQDFASSIQPYVKQRNLMDGFIYLLDGTRLADIAAPATTVLGYMPAPGGRAVAYADGHAQWLPDQPATNAR